MAIPTAKVFTPINEKFENGGDARERGFEAHQHGRSNADVPTNGGQRFMVGTDVAPPDVQTRELKENQRVDQMAEKIKTIIGDDPVGRQVRLARMAQESGLSDIMDPVEIGMIKAAQQPRQPVYEQEEIAPQDAPKGAWTVDAMTAKHPKTGKQIPVWQVRDGRSGMKLPHPFRIMETASRVMAVLNRTGNVNAPQIAQWIQIDKTRVGLISKSRQLKEAVQAGNKGARQQLLEVQEQLSDLDLKIGI